MTETPETPEKADENVVELNSSQVIPGNPYSNIRREITEDDLKSPAVQRILLSEVDKLQSQVSDLEIIQSKFHLADKKSAILEEKLKSTNSHEILYSVTITIGSVIIGLSPTIWDKKYGWIAIAIGSFLIVGGIISKAIKWR